jgi:hypothetical protein
MRDIAFGLLAGTTAVINDGKSYCRVGSHQAGIAALCRPLH